MYEARAGAILCNHYLTDPGISEFFAQVSMGYNKYQLGYTLKNGYYDIIQMAGGNEVVSRRIGLASYANHLASEPADNGLDAWKLNVRNLTIMK